MENQTGGTNATITYGQQLQQSLFAVQASIDNLTYQIGNVQTGLDTLRTQLFAWLTTPAGQAIGGQEFMTEGQTTAVPNRATTKATAKSTKKRVISAETRRKLSEAQKRRQAANKATAKRTHHKQPALVA
jgi:hypothetical protein